MLYPYPLDRNRYTIFLIGDGLTTPATNGDIQDLKAELLRAIRDGNAEIAKTIEGFTEAIKNHEVGPVQTEVALGRPTGLEPFLHWIEKRLNMPPAA